MTEEIIVVKTFEERIDELEKKLSIIDSALGAVIAYVNEHHHDELGSSYVPQKL